MKIKLMRKYSCLLSFLLAGIGAVSVSAPSKAQDVNQNYSETITKATKAIYACHHERDAGECEKAYQIKTDLIGLCGQSNNAKSEACYAQNTVLAYETGVDAESFNRYLQQQQQQSKP